MILDNSFIENEKAKFTDIKAKPQEAIIARLNAEMQYLDERAWQKELMVQYGLIQEEGA